VSVVVTVVIFQIFQLQFQLQLFLVTIRVNGFLVTTAVILIFVNNRVFGPSTKCNNITISTCEHITMCSSVFFSRMSLMSHKDCNFY